MRRAFVLKNLIKLVLHHTFYIFRLKQCQFQKKYEKGLSECKYKCMSWKNIIYLQNEINIELLMFFSPYSNYCSFTCKDEQKKTQSFILCIYWLWARKMGEITMSNESVEIPNSDVKLIRYQFWCTSCAFRLIKSLQWYSGRNSWKSEQIVKTVKKKKKPKKPNAVPWNWAKSVKG
jgi:hypothetical protein